MQKGEHRDHRITCKRSSDLRRIASRYQRD